jgi:hypothetical protein
MLFTNIIAFGSSIEEKKASAQENSTAREIAILNEINLTSTKLATQGAYTALSVFFLGVALVIFGLRLTTKGITHLGKYFTLMVWALTIPVMILISVFQVGIVTNSAVKFHETEEPFFILDVYSHRDNSLSANRTKKDHPFSSSKINRPDRKEPNTRIRKNIYNERKGNDI